jgi:hypothetical protein
MSAKASSDNSFNTLQVTCDTTKPEAFHKIELSNIAQACKRSPVGKNIPVNYAMSQAALLGHRQLTAGI